MTRAQGSALRAQVFVLALLISASAFGATEKKISAALAARNVSAPQRTVTLDVKDAEVRDILKSMQKQCAIKNVIVDPQVQAQGTFYFDHLPCRTAFSVVLRSLGIDAVNYSSSVVTVGTRR